MSPVFQHQLQTCQVFFTQAFNLSGFSVVLWFGFGLKAVLWIFWIVFRPWIVLNSCFVFILIIYTDFMVIFLLISHLEQDSGKVALKITGITNLRPTVLHNVVQLTWMSNPSKRPIQDVFNK